MCAVAVVQKDLAVAAEDLLDPVDRRVWEVVEGELAENGVCHQVEEARFAPHLQRHRVEVNVEMSGDPTEGDGVRPAAIEQGQGGVDDVAAG
ncbi:MAG: hypothetical protein R2692_04885 [Microbacterium sp.]